MIRFRQVVGSKKWWFIPTNQSIYLRAAINVNGFSSHSRTKIGKNYEEQSPWFKKLRRYSSVVNAGDVLLNPAWYWHAIMNLGNRTANDLVIGAPTRYGKGAALPGAFKNNFLYTVNAIMTMIRKHGTKLLDPNFKHNLQGEVANDRRDRDKKPLKKEYDDEE